MAEYATGDRAQARNHLRLFLAAYHKRDGFTIAAEQVLADLAREGGAADCARPLGVDPEGRAIFPPECRGR
jgi:hypothetical protein